MKLTILYDKDKVVGYQTYPHTENEVEITDEEFKRLQEYMEQLSK